MLMQSGRLLFHQSKVIFGGNSVAIRFHCDTNSSGLGGGVANFVPKFDPGGVNPLAGGWCR